MEDKDVDILRDSLMRDVDEVKREQSSLKDENVKIWQEISGLKNKDEAQDREINFIKQSLEEIKEDTKWIKRTLTKAIISGGVTGIVSVTAGVVVWLITF